MASKILSVSRVERRAVSFSRGSNHRRCAARFARSFILRVPMDSDSPDRYSRCGVALWYRALSRRTRRRTWDAVTRGVELCRAEASGDLSLPAIVRPGWLLLFAATYISSYRFSVPRSDREASRPDTIATYLTAVGPSNRPIWHTDATVATPRNIHPWR